MKTLIFLTLSLLIHCFILEPASSRKGQESFTSDLFLRKIKTEPLAKHPPELINPKLKNEFSEPHLFAPKKLSKKKASNLSYRDGLTYLVQSKLASLKKQPLETSETLIFKINIDQNGNLLSAKLSSESEHKWLNETALSAVKDLQKYKPLPNFLHPKATFLVPVHFF